MSSSPSSVSPVASSQSSPSTNWTQENRPSSLQASSAPNLRVSSNVARDEGASPKTKDEGQLKVNVSAVTVSKIKAKFCETYPKRKKFIEKNFSFIQSLSFKLCIDFT